MTVYASVILVVIVILFSVIFGVSKQFVSGQRILCCNKVKLSSCKRCMIHAKFMRMGKAGINDNRRAAASLTHMGETSQSLDLKKKYVSSPFPPHLPSSHPIPPSLPPSLPESCMTHGAAAWEEFHFVTRQQMSSDVSTLANAKTFDFPNSSSNFREIVKLRAAVARWEAEERAEEDRLAGAAAGDDQLRGGGRGHEQRAEGSTTSQGAVVQYYPEPAEETQNNSDHDAGLRGNQSDSHGGIGVAGRSEDTVVFAGGLRSRTNTRNDFTEVSSPALRASTRPIIPPDGDDDH